MEPAIIFKFSTSDLIMDEKYNVCFSDQCHTCFRIDALIVLDLINSSA